MPRISCASWVLLGTIVCSLAVGCRSAPPVHPVGAPDDITVYAAYVLLVEGPDGAAVPFARVITAPGDACPGLVANRPHGRAEMALATSPRQNPHGFAVQVCEAVVPFSTPFEVAGASATLPAVWGETPRRVAVFGDSGCKPSDQGGCTGTDPSQWPLAAFAAAAAADAPDLVLHMGDYNYRGTPSHFQGSVGGQPVTGEYNYDAGDGAPASQKCGLAADYYSQNSSGSTDPDVWENWWLDFFEPAGPLLVAAPWVVARGNHELCAKAGPGWLYFLGPSSTLAAGGGVQTACPDQNGLDTVLDKLVFVPPYTVRLGDLAVSVLDTANACDTQPNFVPRYAAQLGALGAGVSAKDHWMIMHRPIWGVDSPATDTGFDCVGKPFVGPVPPLAEINRTLSCAAATPEAAALVADLDLAMAGHMHRFEWLEWGAGVARPPMLIVGNSGVELNTSAPDGPFSQPVYGESAAGFGLDQFGYVELLRDAAGAWHGQVVALDPTAWSTVLPTCGSAGASGHFLCVKGLPEGG